MLKLQNFSIKDIFSNVDITFEEGKTYVVMGANGVGKSTLLHGIMGRPDLDTHGDVEFNGIDLTELETDERAKLGIFIGFQAPTSIPGLSNFQFIRQANNIKAIDLKENLDKFRDISTQLGLPEEWDKRNLNTDASGGEKKKNELIQMLMLDTKIAMLDEPDSGLDVDGIKSLIEKLSTWKNENNTLVVVTHYEKLIDGLNPDAVVLLKKDGVQIGDKSLADKIFSSGFENV
jgi:Fe-S cluster assembly ATP-binding protein